MRILIAEDDPIIADGLARSLRQGGYAVDWAANGLDADTALVTASYDLLILDLGLPKLPGLEVLKRLRGRNSQLPVLILSARDALTDRLRGLDDGADDYLVKPFALAELLSRVRALARRSYGLEGGTVSLRGLSLDESMRWAAVEGRPVELSRCEFDLLALLLKRAGRVVTRRALEESALPGGLSNESNALDVHISNLRRKIGPGFVRTVRGVGYVIDLQPEAAAR